MEVGQEFRVVFPFVREKWLPLGATNPVDTWKPGVRFEDYGPEDTIAVADAEGEMVLTIVSQHKPGRFPTRVFYTRQFITPDGRAFGRPGLKMCTLEKFNRISRAYQHEYDVEPVAA